MTEIYTDGGCDRKTGIGGYGVIILTDKGPAEMSGAFSNTTTNRMEIMAVLVALRTPPLVKNIRLISDSMYAVRGMNEFLQGWIKNNWHRKNDAGEWETIKNVDLWQRIADTREGRKIIAVHVKGHSGNKWNERADSLATRARKFMRPIEDRPQVRLEPAGRCDF